MTPTERNIHVPSSSPSFQLFFSTFCPISKDTHHRWLASQCFLYKFLHKMYTENIGNMNGIVYSARLSFSTGERLHKIDAHVSVPLCNRFIQLFNYSTSLAQCCNSPPRSREDRLMDNTTLLRLERICIPYFITYRIQ